MGGADCMFVCARRFFPPHSLRDVFGCSVSSINSPPLADSFQQSDNSIAFHSLLPTNTPSTTNYQLLLYQYELKILCSHRRHGLHFCLCLHCSFRILQKYCFVSGFGRWWHRECHCKICEFISKVWRLSQFLSNVWNTKQSWHDCMVFHYISALALEQHECNQYPISIAHHQYLSCHLNAHIHSHIIL